MANYTTVLQKPLDTVSWEDDNFIEELLEIAQLFRPFSDAITEFISDRGYEGNSEDVDAKTIACHYIRNSNCLFPKTT